MKSPTALLMVLLGWGLVLPAHAVAAEPRVTIEPHTGFSEQQVDEIRALVAESRIPARVLILRRLPKAANGSPELHAEHVAVDGASNSVRPSVTLVYSATSIPEFGGFETTKDQDVVSAVEAAANLEGSPREQFVELVRMATTRTGAQVLDEQMAEMWEDPQGLDDDGKPRTESPSSGKVALRWLVIAVAALLVGVFLAFRGRAIAGWWRRRRRTAGLADAAETARDSSLFERARADVLDFGQAIDAESMDEHDALELWNLALDDYDEASRLFDARTGPKDDERVITICARGRDRLAKAQR